MNLRQYYEDLLEMFATPGWKHFLEDMERDHSNVSSIDGVDSLESLFKKKGQRDVIRAILAYEELARQGLEALDEDNS